MKNLLDRGKQVIICGDFNVLRGEIDIYPENLREYYALQGIISDERSNLENLIEIGFIDAFRHKYPEKKILTHFGAIAGINAEKIAVGDWIIFSCPKRRKTQSTT